MFLNMSLNIFRYKTYIRIIEYLKANKTRQRLQPQDFTQNKVHINYSFILLMILKKANN